MGLSQYADYWKRENIFFKERRRSSSSWAGACLLLVEDEEEDYGLIGDKLHFDELFNELKGVRKKIYIKEKKKDTFYLNIE